ncbi:hypothetical protein PHYPSEUDO_011963 [Phytophthora pseudosyringae]|uniref:CH-like domain-containing protein n=1 Tax=Phytophthora pseudosyringae TaxID=221518 RepID=A0A8T1VAD3_9STRA|nr:hypothetical protein PHYPSEUDO_011963 [Phytophthora pseudosyringae]
MVLERSDEMPRGMDSVYDWVDQFSFSRSMKNTARDFSDAVLLAEILAQLVPAWVQLHNYPSAHRFQQKLSNWETLNRKVLTRLKCGISHKHQEDIANAVPGAIELLLIPVKRATANSPFLQAKRASAVISESASTSPRSRSSSATCSPPSTPKQKLPPSPVKSSPLLRTGQRSHEHDSATMSFSKLLQMMSDTTEEFDYVMKSAHSPARNRANSVPAVQLNSQMRGSPVRPLTPNYAKPTLSTVAMARPASVDAKPRLPQVSAFVFPRKNELVSKDSLPILPKLSVEAAQKYLPSDTNEFQEGSFVYFLSSEALPAAFSFGDPEDQAQVARVVKTLPSGECTLQLYRRVPSRDSPQNSPNCKTRRYMATPHFIDCCSTQLHTVPNVTYDDHTSTCEWHLRTKKRNSDNIHETRPKPNQNNSPPPKRHFYTEVLTRVTFTSATLAQPICQTTESVSSSVCVPCPRFAESFRVPVEPTTFPKVSVRLIFELPERFPGRRQLPTRKM